MVASLTWIGCGESEEPEPGNPGGSAGQAGSAAGGSKAGGGGGGASGGGGAAGMESAGPPLLERPADITYDCEVTRPMALLGLNPWVVGGLHPTGDSAYLTRLQGTMPGGSFGMKVTWSPLGFDGKLGEAHSLESAGQAYLGQLTASQADARLTLLWTEGSSGGTQLALASVEATGTVLAPRKQVTTGAAQRQFPTLAPLGEGYAVAWTRQSTGGAAGSAIELLRVDADGNPSGDVQTLLEGSGLLQSHQLVALGGGLVLLYSQFDYTANLQANYYAVLDEAGKMKGQPVKLGDGFGPTSTLVRGEKLLVAWTQQTGNFDSKIARTIHVGSIDASGERSGPAFALQAPVVDQENVDPHWVDMGDDVGLFWSQGSVIYICAGCFPDNELRFVVLGGDDLKRKSEVLSLPSPTVFGLRSPLAVREQDEILTVASVTHHVDAEGASATLRCTP